MSMSLTDSIAMESRCLLLPQALTQRDVSLCYVNSLDILLPVLLTAIQYLYTLPEQS